MVDSCRYLLRAQGSWVTSKAELNCDVHYTAVFSTILALVDGCESSIIGTQQGVIYF